MGFVLTQQELVEQAGSMPATWYDADVLMVKWETDGDLVQQLLPPPLQPGPKPIATAYVANLPRTSFGVGYREAALALSATFHGTVGDYFLAMPVTDDWALILGREAYGFPKKMADIGLYRADLEAVGWVERRGVRFAELRAELTNQFNEADAQAAFTNASGPDGQLLWRIFNFKSFPAADGSGFDYPPRLVTAQLATTVETLEIGEADVILRPSASDPWHDVNVVRVLGATYLHGMFTLSPGEVLAEVDPRLFAPYTAPKLELFAPARELAGII